MNGRADRTADTLGRLCQGTCGGYLAVRENVQLISLLDRLIYDRFEEKHDRVNNIYHASGQNWNQAFYALLFRHVGDMKNRETYMELARRADYTTVLRIKNSQPKIEALLMGAAGLLPTFRPDDYIRYLRTEFEHLQAKYDIVPLDPKAWNRTGIQPANKTYLRIAQLASFLAQHNFVFEQVLACRTREEVHRLFSAEASTYWSNLYGETGAPKQIGWAKTDVYGINVVAILQYAYGSYIGDEKLRDSGINLLEILPPEENAKVDRWKAYGIKPRNAYDTQALVQLFDYCEGKQCGRCPVGKQIAEKVNNGQ